MCEQCEPLGGYWRWKDGIEGGLTERCTCADGARAAGEDERRKNRKALPPVISSTGVTIFVEMLAGGLPFFPGESGARLLIGEELRSMCHDDADALDFVTYLSRRWKKWEGIAEMRKAYCASRVPLDAVIDEEVSAIYPDGYPTRLIEGPERATLAAAPATKLLAAGPDHVRSRGERDAECAAGAADLRREIATAAEQKRMSPPAKKRLREGGKL